MQLDTDSVPSTFDEAVAALLEALTEADKKAIAKTPPERVHFTAGMTLRNNWSLWDRKSPLNLDFQKRFGLFGHGDDVSGLLLHCVWKDVKGEPREIEKEVARFKEHWTRSGIDPVTGEEVGEDKTGVRKFKVDRKTGNIEEI